MLPWINRIMRKTVISPTGVLWLTTPLLFFFNYYSSGDCSSQRWILSSLLHTTVAPLLQATQLRATLRRWTWHSPIQVTLATLPDQWDLQVLIPARDSPRTKATLDNRSTVGRGDPLLRLCMGKLPKTQVKIKINYIYNSVGTEWFVMGSCQRKVNTSNKSEPLLCNT